MLIEMMMTQVLTISDIRKLGYDALIDAARYIRSFEEGFGLKQST